MVEVVRGGIESIDPGQMEAAKSIGMTHRQAMINIIPSLRMRKSKLKILKRLQIR